jgi:Domain of unknown function (DUF6475)
MGKRETFAASLAILGGTFNRQITGPVLEGYWMALEDLGDEALATAVKKSLVTCKFMPTPAELRELAGVKEITTQGKALDAWAYVVSEIRRVGQYMAPNITDPVVRATVRQLGGWVRLCEMDSEQLHSFERQAFLKAYDANTARTLGDDSTRALGGRFTQLVGEIAKRLESVPESAGDILGGLGKEAAK